MEYAAGLVAAADPPFPVAYTYLAEMSYLKFCDSLAGAGCAMFYILINAYRVG
jgi:hypothetical protein